MIAALIARLRVLLFPAPRLRFFWIGEKSEIFVAHSLKEALDAFAQPDDLKDRAYGEVNRYRTVFYHDEAGEMRVGTLEEIARGCRVPNLLMSQYC
ncbi:MULTISPECIES: hypothetical protein [Burkholderia]|uniref:Uncharacterized protein n=1 Tax=Burkholderia aenigmatica TaxID=2015348 RepID=A0A6J5JKK9_9BURK|nr:MULTISPECIES: hypothetical protein [Burkholderia]CAB3972279.1 hypothetical protein BLA3211_06885 [Burkholderia aenigmatica]